MTMIIACAFGWLKFYLQYVDGIALMSSRCCFCCIGISIAVIVIHVNWIMRFSFKFQFMNPFFPQFKTDFINKIC